MRRSEPATATRTVLRAAVVLVLLGAVVLIGRFASRDIAALVSRIRTLGAWGPVAFIAAYVVASVALVPASVFTIASGALFGLVEGTIVVFVAATIGAAAGFLIARYAARRAVARRLAADRRFDAIDRAIGIGGFKIVVLLRLSPMFPFSIMNYVLGLTRVSFMAYLLASVGMIPGIILYVYSGKLAGDVVTATAHGPAQRGVAYYALLSAGILATVLVAVIIARIARRALEAATGPAATTQEMPASAAHASRSSDGPVHD